jgi:hypothetical protein
MNARTREWLWSLAAALAYSATVAAIGLLAVVAFGVL